MKRILMAAVLAGMAGGVYASDFSDLQALKASDVKMTVKMDAPKVTRSDPNLPQANTFERNKVAVVDGGINGHRSGITDCPALQSNPQEAQANFECGSNLAEDGDSINAIHYLKKAITLDTQNSWIKGDSLKYLGACYFVIGNHAKSKDAILESIDINGTQNTIYSSQWFFHLFGYDDLFRNWSVMESEHFIFHFQTPSVVQDHSQFMKQREDAYSAIVSFFGNIELPYKIQYFVWNSKTDAMQNVGFNLGFAIPPFSIVHTSFDNETPGHESTHIIVSRFNNFANSTMFINEGIAVYLNQSNMDNLAIVRQWLKNDPEYTTSIKALWTDRPLPSKYYPLAGAFIAHLLEKAGKEKLLNLIMNQSYAEATKIYGCELDSIISEFEAKLRKIGGK